MSLKDKILFPGKWYVRQMEKGGYKQSILPNDLFDELCEEDKQKIIEFDKNDTKVWFSIVAYSIIIGVLLFMLHLLKII
jgi:hypothetical protein